MTKTILITGANGMLGMEASQIFSDAGYNVIKTTKDNLDITNHDQVQKFFSQNDFDIVLHCAAYTKVDDAETHQDLAFAINSEGAKNVAIASNNKSIPIIYISTDYVFDGTKNSPYLTSDKTNPINVYGASKLAGEENVRKSNPQHYIARTSWLYGKHGKNFVDTMISLSEKQSEIKVVDDQFGCPTWTFDLVHAIKNLIEENMDFGTYHFCSSGFTNWFSFAKKIFEIMQKSTTVIPVPTSQFLRPAKRPSFSAMENNKIIRHWEDGLNNYLNQNK